MKARLITLFLFTSIVFFALSGTAWAGYVTTQLTSNEYYDRYPQINTAGMVVWEGSGINLYHDGITTKLYDYGQNPQINASGQVVWEAWDGHDGEIFLFSDGAITKLTDNFGSDHDPQINDTGQVVWEGRKEVEISGNTASSADIYLYSGGATTQITDNAYPDVSPQISGSGQVVWQGTGGAGGGSDYEIFLFDGNTVQQLTSNGTSDSAPQINDSSQVVWEGYDGEDARIYLFSGGTTTNLGISNNDSAQSARPKINNSGQVVWTGNITGIGYDIYLYSYGITIRLTDNAYVDISPQINDNGQVIWRGYDTGFALGAEIYLYSDGAIERLTEDAYSTNSPQINGAGQMVWEGLGVAGGSDLEIFLASCCTGGEPSLSLSLVQTHWASYADYTAGELSVEMTVANSGAESAHEVQIAGSTNTNGVTLSTGVPTMIGDIPGGATSAITLKYHVPTGVGSFKTTVYATAQDTCGTTYSYPGPYPGT